MRALWSETFGAELSQSRGTGETFAAEVAEHAQAIISGLDAPTLVDGEEPVDVPDATRDCLFGYELLSVVGAGGMGEVWGAKQRTLKRHVAVKVNKRLNDPLSRAVFVSEAMVTAHLAHPNIVPVYDLMVDLKTNAFSMKKIEGESWSRALGSDLRNVRHEDADREGLYGELELEKHLKIFFDVCDALAFAHEKGVLHNDLKPANVMVGRFGEVLLLDWGLALDFTPEKRNRTFLRHISTVQRPFGTPEFLAPEVARGDGRALGPWTDVYSLGAILYFIVEGYSAHWGESTLELIENLVDGERHPISPKIDPELREILESAMALDPAERTRSVVELKASLETYLKHQQSRLLTQAADHLLEDCRLMRTLEVEEEAKEGRGSRIYSQYVEAYSTFRQASHLWRENDEAREGRLIAHFELATWAVEQGDLALARAQIPRLTDDMRRLAEVTLAVEMATRARSRAQRRQRLVRILLLVTTVLLVVGAYVSFKLIGEEKVLAENNAALATERLENIRRLSDIELLEQKREEADQLWPALPAKASSIRDWIRGAMELVARQEAHAAYVLKVCKERGRAQPDGGCAFDSHVDTWEYETFATLASGLGKLRDEAIPDLRARLATADTLQAKTIDEVSEAWTAAAASAANNPAYGGLGLVPQLGLIPLGSDPTTGLEEFAHVQSGEVPKRDQNGKIVLTEASGIVLVLIPGGSFMMGSKRPGPDAALGQANVDPDAKDIEGPVHRVALAPFLMGKYELTQGQWQRFHGENPAAYAPGREIGGNVHDGRHPVEQVRWKEAKRLLSRLDLDLPTEAQWEYSIRAGTQTVFWTGDDKRTLQGATNLSDRYCHTHDGPKSWRHEDWLDDGYTVHAPVGSYRANAFGIHDMAGNVWEWVRDGLASYKEPVREGDGLRKAPDNAPRVFRGGGFRATVVHARSAERYGLYAPEYRAYDVGLRAARKLRHERPRQIRP